MWLICIIHLMQMDQSKGITQDTLTLREKEILKLIAEGYSNSKIGTVLNISTRTVSTHRDNIRRKLHVNNVAGMVRYAFKFKLVE